MNEATRPRAEATAARAGGNAASPAVYHTHPLRAAALAALAAGLAVVPPREDGSKAPLNSWKRYQRARPGRELVEAWYRNGRCGLGLVTGAVSGNLEAFEFDSGGEVYEAFKARAAAVGLGALVARIERGYLERTPSGGVHWLYRCSTIASNTKLACRPKRPAEQRDPHDKVAVLIETRGEGGYVVVAPSHGAVHPTGRPYELLAGSFATIATITPEEREALWELARTFDEMPKAAVAEPPAPRAGDRPGDVFNQRAAWGEVLEPHGWRAVYARDGVTYWRRPGKPAGVSATTNYAGSDLLYVFSTSTPFDAERGYSKFAAYAVLNHGGDFTAAARALAAKGYGTPAPALAGEAADGGSAPAARPRLVRLDAVAPTPLAWLWPGYLPLGKLALLEGDPGLGKSLLALDLAARVTRGGPLPDGAKGLDAPAGVVLLLAEDDLADTVRPRLDAAGADPARVVALQTAGDPTDPDRPPTTLDVEALRHAIHDVGARLVIVDPLTAFLPAKTDAHTDADVRHALAPLARLAAEERVTVLAIRHLNKSTALPALYRGGGSIAFTAAARAVLLVGRHPEDPTQRVLAPLKANLAPEATALAFSLVNYDGPAPHVAWHGATEHTAGDLLSSAGREERLTALHEVHAALPTAPPGATPAELAAATGLRVGTVKNTLGRLKAQGLAAPVARGRWVRSSSSSSLNDDYDDDDDLPPAPADAPAEGTSSSRNDAYADDPPPAAPRVAIGRQRVDRTRLQELLDAGVPRAEAIAAATVAVEAPADGSGLPPAPGGTPTAGGSSSSSSLNDAYDDDPPLAAADGAAGAREVFEL